MTITPSPHRLRRAVLIGVLVLPLAAAAPVPDAVPLLSPASAAAKVTGGKGGGLSGGSSGLVNAAKNATHTTRSVVGQLIAIALCVAAAVLVFKRDFAEAAAVFVVGMLALLLVDPAGIGLLKSTVKSLFGH